MLKRILVKLFVALILFSCASTGGSSRLGTGKPKFASLEVEGVSYFLSSENGTFTHGKPLNLILKVTNVSAYNKKFVTEGNIFLILQVKNEFRESLENLNIPADSYLKNGSFSLDPGEEKVYEITFLPEKSEYKEHDSIYCQIRLFFLPKQFRRNTLSVYLDRK
jgi:hypothetical protein